jgi:hypothetical protein
MHSAELLSATVTTWVYVLVLSTNVLLFWFSAMQAIMAAVRQHNDPPIPEERVSQKQDPTTTGHAAHPSTSSCR